MGSSFDFSKASPIPGRADVAVSALPSVAAVRPRLDSIDLLRGLVMVLMAWTIRAISSAAA